jgi:hypothetical protein
MEVQGIQFAYLSYNYNSRFQFETGGFRVWSIRFRVWVLGCRV